MLSKSPTGHELGICGPSDGHGEAGKIPKVMEFGGHALLILPTCITRLQEGLFLTTRCSILQKDLALPHKVSRNYLFYKCRMKSRAF